MPAKRFIKALRRHDGTAATANRHFVGPVVGEEAGQTGGRQAVAGRTPTVTGFTIGIYLGQRVSYSWAVLFHWFTRTSGKGAGK
jgi:hypothetical protein